MRESTREETMHNIDQVKIFIDQMQEVFELSPMVMGEYKKWESKFNSARLNLDSVEDNVRYSG